ncbi:hypothetical protein CF68_13860 [Cupriavidus sp. SK-4]|nr:hypothetical protein CF68_13860 [Cupriavidus sp. SK-4]
MTDQHIHIYDHPSLAELMRIYREIALVQLESLTSGGPDVSLPSSALATVSIIERTGEIQTSLDYLSLAGEFLRGTLAEDGSFHERDYQYHYENILFRAVGAVDRMFLLAGSAAFMETKQLERSGANLRVNSALPGVGLTDALEVLKAAEERVASLRTSRNNVAHNSGYSDVMLQAAGIQRSPGLGDVFRQNLDKYHRDGLDTAKSLHTDLYELSERLLIALQPAFDFIVETHSQST